MSTPHHVIVGAGIAGVSAAMAMRDHGFEGGITLVDAEPYLPYERPPLSKTGSELKPLFPVDAYAEKQIELRLGTRVANLDPDRRRVLLSDGDDLEADQVLLATGVAARRTGVPGENLDGVLTLRTADDAALLFAHLDKGGPLVVVGGGFIGLEAAALASERGIDVTVIEAGELPLLGPLGPAVANLVATLHRDRGVRIHTGVTVAEYSGAGRVEQVRLTSGHTLPATTVILGCGVVPNDMLAGSNRIHCDGGIVASRTGRTSHAWTWTAGDVASQQNPYIEGRARIEHWDVARRHGAAVGASMAGVPTENAEVPYFWSDQFGLTLQMFGRSRQGDTIVLRKDASPEKFLAFWVRNGLVVGVAGLDQVKGVRAGKKLIELSASVDPAVLADPNVDLRALSKKVATSVVS